MSPDLRLATVYVASFGGKDVKAVLQALDRAKRYIRGEVARVINLKFAPDIRFMADETFDEVRRIDEVLRSPHVAQDLEKSCTPDASERRLLMAVRRVMSWRGRNRLRHARALCRAAPIQVIGSGMARRKKGNPVHGWVVLDKPPGMTSTQAVAAVRRLFMAQKAGHAGTLDPLATGVLPIALGEATKTVPFAVDGAQGLPLQRALGCGNQYRRCRGYSGGHGCIRPSRSQIEALLPQFIGEIMQTPPAFSAIKVDGERAYDLARSGSAVELEARPVAIDRLELVDMPDADTALFETECGRGTYVRALARDLGRLLGCRGHVAALRRTRVGTFTDEAATSLQELQQAAGEGGEGGLASLLLPIETALEDLLEINVSQADAARLARGQPVLLRGRDAPIVVGDAFAISKGTLVALCEVSAGELRPTRVFNYGQ